MRSTFTVLIACVALASCASVRKADVSLPVAYEAPASAAPAGAVALDRWWLTYGDAELTGLIDQALAASPDAKQRASQRLREADATVRETLYERCCRRATSRATPPAEHDRPPSIRQPRRPSSPAR